MEQRTVTLRSTHLYTGLPLKAVRCKVDSYPLYLIADDGMGPSVRLWDLYQSRWIHVYEVPSDQVMATLSDVERDLINQHVPAEAA